MKEIDILAINISLRPSSTVKTFPIGLSYVLSSVKRAGYDFELLDIDAYRFSDEEVHKKLAESRWHVVLLGCIVTGYSKVKRIVSDIRKTSPEALIVVGNSVASSIPEILLSKTEADVAVIGEGDITVVDILNKWSSTKDLNEVKGIYYEKDGKIFENSKREVIPDINTIPYPIHDLFDVERYIEGQRNAVGEPLPMDRELIRPFPIIISRGCISRCTFCYHCFIGNKYRYRSAKHIGNEIKQLKSLYAINYIFLWDDLTFFSKKQVRDFVNLLTKEKLDIYWMSSVRGNLFQTREDLNILKEMKDAGCLRLNYALESADEEILKAMNKNVSLDQFRRQKELLDEAGIESKTSLVLGYPQETPTTIAKTFQFCLDIGIYPSVGFLLPQPRTPIYEWAKQNNYIKDEEEYLVKMGDRQDLRINLTKMDDNEFLDAVTFWVKKLNAELNIGLDENRLLKTQYHRSKEKRAIR